MDPIVALRQVLLFGHLIVFALAFGEILRADVAILLDFPQDARALHRTALLTTIMLGLLWLSGLALVLLDSGLDFAVLAQKPKLMTKLLVVGALTGNGWLLHRYAFPALEGRVAGTRARAVLCSILGAVSSVSWLYAAFVGVARIIAPQTTLPLFLGLYGVLLAGGIAVGVIVVSPRLTMRFSRASLGFALDQLRAGADGIARAEKAPQSSEGGSTGADRQAA